MKPLTALKYFKENKRKALVSFIVLIFTVCAISLITVLINSITGTINDINVKPVEYFSTIAPIDGEYFLNNSVVKSLKNNPDIDKLIDTDIGGTSVNLAIGGTTTVPVLFTDKGDLETIMSTMKATIRKGRMPENKTNEIAVHWRVMANKGWKLGDTVGSFKNKKEFLIGEYKIVGEIDGPNIIFIGTESYKQKQLQKISKVNNPRGYLVFHKEGKRDAVNTFIDSIDKSQANTFTYNKIKEILDEQLKGLNSTIVAIILVVILILSISVGSLMYVIYIQRSDEFGILYAIGYRKKSIATLIIKEIMSLNLISWTLGLVFSYGVISMLNRAIYNPRGDVISIFSLNVLIYTLMIPVIVGLFSIFPITMRLRNWDPIAIIERRE
ncbi:MAG: ABC transporter permease [Clostridia bacterium]|nr:ABC transporter permease [Clostridia bacterium]